MARLRKALSKRYARRATPGAPKRPSARGNAAGSFFPTSGTPTEAEIQRVLYESCLARKHPLVVPNTRVFGWESDLLSVTPAGIVHDFEIKRTRADFVRDFEKPRHKDLSRYERWRVTDRRPNYFWYVFAGPLAPAGDVPPHAGLIVMDCRTGALTEVVRAPRLHVHPLDGRTREYLERGLRDRYWATRL